MKTEEYAVFPLSNPIVSYQCLICEKVQDERANIVNTAIAWLCPECKRKLRKLIDEFPTVITAEFAEDTNVPTKTAEEGEG